MANKKRRNLNSTLAAVVGEILEEKEKKDDTIEVSSAEIYEFGEVGLEESNDQTIIEDDISKTEKQIIDYRLKVDEEEATKTEVISSESVELIDISLLKPNPTRVRQIISENELEILKDSIKKHGLINPLIVRKSSDKTSFTYEIVSGYRRYLACLELKKLLVPVIVRDIDDTQSIMIGLIDNLIREDLHPIEETIAILNLLSKITGYTRTDICRILTRIYREQYCKVTPSASLSVTGQRIVKIFEVLPVTLSTFINHRLKLIKLHEEVLEAVLDNKVAASVGIMIDSMLPDEDIKLKLLRDSIKYSYTREQVKEKIAELRSLYYEGETQQVKYQLRNQVKRLLSNTLWDSSDPQYLKDLQKIIDQLQELTIFYEAKRSKQKNT